MPLPPPDETSLQLCQRQLRVAKATLEACQKELDASRKQLLEADAALKGKDGQISRLAADLTALTNKSLELTNALEAATKVRPMISVDELIGQLRTSLEGLNEEAKQRPGQGKAQLLVDQFEVELKGGIDLKKGLRLTQLQGQEISPQSVSTIRFALKPVPVITIIDNSTTNQ